MKRYLLFYQNENLIEEEEVDMPKEKDIEQYAGERWSEMHCDRVEIKREV